MISSKSNSIRNEIKQNFYFVLFYKNPLFVAVEVGNINIVKLLLSSPKIDVNMKIILTTSFFHNVLMHRNVYNIYIFVFSKDSIVICSKTWQKRNHPAFIIPSKY